MRAAETRVGVVLERDVRLQQRDQPVLRAGLAVAELAARPPQPGGADGVVAPEVEVVAAQPGRHARRADVIGGVAVAAVRPLARGEGRLRVALPPRGTAQPLPRGRRAARGHGSLESLPRSVPVAAPQRLCAVLARVVHVDRLRHRDGA